MLEWPFSIELTLEFDVVMTSLYRVDVGVRCCIGLSL